jgi:hypothetical protein
MSSDLEWWRIDRQDGNPIYKPIETAYLYADSSCKGWGAVLNKSPALQ